MTTSSRWVIGRLPECDIVLAESGVSGRHCCLTRTAHGFTLEDLGSSNGTFINGQRIVGVVAVNPTDRVTLGQQVPLPWPGPPLARTVLPPPAPEGAGSARSGVARTQMVPGSTVVPTQLAAPSPSSRGTVRTLNIGRSPDNDIVFDHPTVSGRHARVTIRGDGTELEDLGSSNGIFVNDRTRRIQKATLARSDIVFLGSLRVPADRLLGHGGADAPARQLAVVNFTAKAMVFGRDPSCDQILDYPMISARHARLTRKTDGMLLEDLGSSNGTFVNGKRIGESRQIRPGDVVGLGSYTFTLTDDGDLQRRDFRGNATLEARQLAVQAGGRMLIGGIDLTILPGEFVGLMGPSGAGKTTLMNALNGYVPPTKGSVMLNGQDLYRHYDQFRSVLGYVPQEDVMHRDLTVGQALYYSARMRLPPDYSQADIQARISKVLTQLGLNGTENVLIGSAEKKGISGGQRRRVNLAMELLTDPLVLYLDEPTSGLSSEDALTVMKVLRGLADNGKTILLTIHQPNLEVYRLMDHLVLLGKDLGTKDPGRLVYFGPAYPEAVTHFNPGGIPNQKPGIEPLPDEVLRGLSRRKTEEWVQHFKVSPHYKTFVRERYGAQPPDAEGTSDQNTRPVSSAYQWWVLVRRLLTIKIKDRMNTAILLAQAPIVAILIVMVFGKQMTEKVSDSNWLDVANSLGTTLFLMALAAIWFGASNAVREIVGEWAIYHRERMVNLRIAPYVASKYTVLGGLCVLQCVLLLGIVHVCCGLKAPLLLLFAMLMLGALVGTTVGLLLSALARTSEVAIALLPIVLLPMVILGGAIQPVHKMHAVPRIISMVVPTRWAFEGMMLVESKRRPNWTAPEIPVMPKPGKPPEKKKKEPEQDMAELFFQKEKYRDSVGLSMGVLAAMLVVGCVGVAGILRSRDVH